MRTRKANDRPQRLEVSDLSERHAAAETGYPVRTGPNYLQLGAGPKSRWVSGIHSIDKAVDDTESKRARQSIRYPQPKPNWIAPDGRQIYLPKVGHVRVVMHRPLAGVMKNVTVSRTKSGKYFVSIHV